MGAWKSIYTALNHGRSLTKEQKKFVKIFTTNSEKKQTSLQLNLFDMVRQRLTSNETEREIIEAEPRY